MNLQIRKKLSTIFILLFANLSLSLIQCGGDSDDSYSYLCDTGNVLVDNTCVSFELADEIDPDSDGVSTTAATPDNCPSVWNASQHDDHEVNAGQSADGVGDDCDNCPEVYNPDQADSNADGVGDACEGTTGTSLTTGSTDSDGDGVLDTVDNCPNAANTDQCDSNHNGKGNVCDTAPLSSCPTDLGLPDTDGDGICDDFDNCPGFSNECQEDSDSDGIGDLCQNDPDSDGITSDADNCPSTSNTDQSDADGDGVGDACDNCPSKSNTDQADVDQDEIGDACDNCPASSNYSQTNSDQDSLGDSCDNCTSRANEDQLDANNDDIGDVCSDFDLDGIKDSVDPDVDGDGLCDSDLCTKIDPTNEYVNPWNFVSSTSTTSHSTQISTTFVIGTLTAGDLVTIYVDGLTDTSKAEDSGVWYNNCSGHDTSGSADMSDRSHVTVGICISNRRLTEFDALEQNFHLQNNSPALMR